MELTTAQKIQKIILNGKHAVTHEAAVEAYLEAICLMLLNKIYPEGAECIANQ